MHVCRTDGGIVPAVHVARGKRVSWMTSHAHIVGILLKNPRTY